MAIYTLTTNLIENLKPSDIKLIASLLYELTNDKSEHKLAIDNNKRLLNLYKQANVDIEIEQYYKPWVDFLSKVLNNVCEFISVNINISDKNQAFLEVASNVNGSKEIVVYSRNNNCPYKCNEVNMVKHNGASIKVLDRNEAAIAINTRSIIENNYTTDGDGSPIIVGNQNEVKLKKVIKR